MVSKKNSMTVIWLWILPSCWKEQAKGSEGVAFLERYIASLPVHKGKGDLNARLRDLRRRVLDQSTNSQPGATANEFHAKKLLSFYELTDHQDPVPQRGVRLFMQGNVAVIVYFYHESSEYGYGVLRFDTDRLQVVSDQRAGKNARMRFMKYMSQFFFSGPAVAYDGRDVFVAHSTEGILVFPSDGQPRLLTEETGLASQHIWRLEALDGKLYAIIGEPGTETGFMEVDWKSGASRILWSQRSKAADSLLAGHGTHGILADSNKHILWVLSDDGSPGPWGKTNSLYTFSPRDNRVDLKQKDFLLGRDYSMRWTDGAILLWQNEDHGECRVFNPDTVKAETIYGNPNATFPYRKQPNRVVWQMPQALFKRSLTFIGDELMAFKDRELLWFHTGVAEPVSMLARIFPKEIADKIYFYDVAPTKQGLLMLSEDGLYLVPEIKPPTQPAATAASK